MSALRVAFVDQVGDVAGGAEQTLATFLENAPPGLEASAILFEDGGFADRLRGLGVNVDVLEVSDDVRSSTREHPRLQGALALPRIALAAATLLRARRAAVVYTNSMKAHFVGALAGRLARIPCVMHFHDLIAGTGLAALRSAAIVGSRERIACSRMVSRAIGIGATTVIYGPIERAVYGALPDRTEARAVLGLPAGEDVVAIVGRINRWKGHDLFLRVAARVNAVTRARFAIVGAPVFRDADFVPELHALVDQLGLRDRVSFIPWVDDVRIVYAALDVNVNCSTREPFGRAVVEAAACGVPTVCFDDSGAAETMVDGVTGRLAPAGDEQALADALIELLRSPARRALLGDAARTAAARFDAPVVAAEMAAVIRRAAA